MQKGVRRLYPGGRGILYHDTLPEHQSLVGKNHCELGEGNPGRRFLLAIGVNFSRSCLILVHQKPSFTPSINVRFMYYYIKALHIIFVVTWFAGLFYMPRLFIYNTEAGDKPAATREALRDQFAKMLNHFGTVLPGHRPSLPCSLD